MTIDRSNLTEEQIMNLSLEMKACYLIQPWNNGFQGKTREERAAKIGFLPFRVQEDTGDYDYDVACKEAVKNSTEVYDFLVKFVAPPEKTYEPDLNLTAAGLQMLNVSLGEWNKEQILHNYEMLEMVANIKALELVTFNETKMIPDGSSLAEGGASHFHPFDDE